MAKSKKRINKSHQSHVRRAASIAHGVIRKEARNGAQKAAQRRNRARGYSAWDVAVARRTARLGRVLSPEQRGMLTKEKFSPETGKKLATSTGK
jgi:hypothetical protein